MLKTPYSLRLASPDHAHVLVTTPFATSCETLYMIVLICAGDSDYFLLFIVGYFQSFFHLHHHFFSSRHIANACTLFSLAFYMYTSHLLGTHEVCKYTSTNWKVIPN